MWPKNRQLCRNVVKVGRQAAVESCEPGSPTGGWVHPSEVRASTTRARRLLRVGRCLVCAHCCGRVEHRQPRTRATTPYISFISKDMPCKRSSSNHQTGPDRLIPPGTMRHHFLHQLRMEVSSPTEEASIQMSGARFEKRRGCPQADELPERLAQLIMVSRKDLP